MTCMGSSFAMLKNLALKYVAKQDADGNIDEDGFKDYVRFLAVRSVRTGTVTTRFR